MTIDQIVARAAELRASDVHIVRGLPLRVRVNGALTDMGGEPLSHGDCEAYALALAGDAYRAMEEKGELDLARSLGGSRVRVNLFRQQGHVSAVLRLLSDKLPALEELGLPPAVSGFAELRRGVVLVTGETGSGKSTTLAALLERINRTRPAHILTLEDPIEYIYAPDRCIINQREVGRDTDSFASGLRAALREDPDIILIGEMRDLETIEIALTAAETGHLVFATLHTGSAADAVDRMVDVFPPERHRQIRMQLSMTLRSVVSQQLVPRADGRGRVPACEVMVVNAAIRNLIREGKTPMIQNAIATTAAEGGVTMDAALIRLAKARVITAADAVERANDQDFVKKSI